MLSAKRNPKIKSSVDLSFRTKGHIDTGATFHGKFYLVPGLAYDVYLGDGFLRSEKMICFNSSNIYTSIHGILGQECISRFLAHFEGVQRTPIKCIKRPRDVNQISQCKVDEGKEIKPITKVPDNYSRVEPQQEDSKAFIPRQEFEKMISSLGIDGREKDKMYTEYLETGRTQIPVSNYIEESFESSDMRDTVEEYYNDLDDLIRVFDLGHLPPAPLRTLKNFLEQNMDVFSKSETDVGFVPNYEAVVVLKRDVKDVNVKFNPFPAAIREKVGTILRRYRKTGIISYAGDDIRDPIISNLLAIMKPNKQIRACFDARFVNYLTAKGKCFHRSLTQTLRDIDLNSKYFCILDLSAAYFCIAIHPDSRRYF